MATVRVRHNISAYANIRRAPGVRADLERRAGKIAAAGNRRIGEDGYRVSSLQGNGRAPRWRATVITARPSAMRDNMKNNTLVKSMGEARGR